MLGAQMVWSFKTAKVDVRQQNCVLSSISSENRLSVNPQMLKYLWIMLTDYRFWQIVPLLYTDGQEQSIMWGGCTMQALHTMANVESARSSTRRKD